MDPCWVAPGRGLRWRWSALGCLAHCGSGGLIYVDKEPQTRRECISAKSIITLLKPCWSALGVLLWECLECSRSGSGLIKLCEDQSTGLCARPHLSPSCHKSVVYMWGF